MAVRDPPVAALIAGAVDQWADRVCHAHCQSGGGTSPAAYLRRCSWVRLPLQTRPGTVPMLLDSDVTTRVAGMVEAREFDAEGRVRYLLRLTNTADPQIRRPPDAGAAFGKHVRISRRRSVPRISGRARLTAPSGPVMPGGYDFAFRSFADGIGAQGYFFRAPTYSLEPPAQAWCRAGLERLACARPGKILPPGYVQVLPGDPGGIAAALTVSDRRGISREPTVEALRATGLAHILAISGLHMALAAGILYIGLQEKPGGVSGPGGGIARQEGGGRRCADDRHGLSADIGRQRLHPAGLGDACRHAR
jgi:competence protein ComEC